MALAPHFPFWRSFAVWLGVGLLVMVTGLVIELLYIKYNGTPVPAPIIPREPETIGSGHALTYVVLGDSTTVAQGGSYDNGIARTSARHLAKKYRVTLVNLGVSGARVVDVAQAQAPKAVAYKPDVVLMVVGANDVTHLTALMNVRNSFIRVIEDLRQANPSVRIVVTGAPAMGSIPRFPQPIRAAAAWQTSRLNAIVATLAQEKQVIVAPVARETGAAFAADPTLFAADKFHPNDRGYRLWHPVIHRALDEATRRPE